MVVGIGTDTEPVESFSSKPFAQNEPFYTRLFSQDEIDYCLSKKNPYPHFAGKFCAKEALVKATSVLGAFLITDFQILSQTQGAPKALPWKSRSTLNVQALFESHDVMVTVSHSENHAVATALIQRI